MTNGSNTWAVSYSHIRWLELFLQKHKNLEIIERNQDILFRVTRRKQKDSLIILCCNEYTMSLAKVMKGLDEFGSISIFYIGGGWCGYTLPAKEYCLEQSIGLYVTEEMSGALWKDDFWAYSRKDERGNPIYHTKAA